MFCVHVQVLRACKVILKKNDFYMAYVKMINFGTKISLFAIFFLST
jgi:hypothetical protein